MNHHLHKKIAANRAIERGANNGSRFFLSETSFARAMLASGTVNKKGNVTLLSDPNGYLEFIALVSIASFGAGLLHPLTGLGGGVVLVPLLTIFFHVDIRYAIGASLVSVIATSSGAAASYVKEGFSNIRIGMFLEIATTFGALLGAFLATRIPTSALAVIFGLMLLYSAYLSRRPRTEAQRSLPPDPLATRLRLNGSFPDRGGPRSYNVQHVPTGFSLMFGAGALSGLLALALEPSKCWPWTRPCGSHSKFPRLPATS